MATRVNRAATASNKKGGKTRKRNQSSRLYDSHDTLDSDENQEAFDAGTHETMARNRNASAGVPTEENATGVPEARDFSIGRNDRSRPEQIANSPRLSLDSVSLGSHRELPTKHTADGANHSPPLSWSGIPPYTEELVLLCIDLDSENTPYIHWLVYRIPANSRGLPAGITGGDEIPQVLGALQGRNSAGTLGYVGPNPPYDVGWHHYSFRLYALDQALNDLRPGMSWEELSKLMTGHILQKAELLTRFRRTLAYAV